jgi:hypothetical protein
MALPEDKDIKPGRYPEWRKLPNVEPYKTVEIITALAEK